MSRSGLVLFGGMGVTTAGLGIWQLSRYDWKLKLLENKEADLKLPVSTMSDISSIYGADSNVYSVLPNYKGKRIRLTGTYDHSKELFLGLRSAPQLLDGGHAQGMATNPQGFYIITPFSLQDGRGTVFINRGWIPKNMRDFSRPEGVVEAVGEVQDPEKKTPFSPINTPASGRLLWLSGRDLVQHVREGAESDKSTLRSQQDSIECVIILERLEEAENEGPVDMPTRVSRAGSLPTDSRAYPLARSTASSSADNCYITPEIHLAYALTWFSLSVASLVIGYFNFKKSSRMIRKYAPKLPPAGRT